jgi:hypothetical protein
MLAKLAPCNVWTFLNLRKYPLSSNEKFYIALVLMTEFWWGKVRERDYLGDPGVDGRIN